MDHLRVVLDQIVLTTIAVAKWDYLRYVRPEIYPVAELSVLSALLALVESKSELFQLGPIVEREDKNVSIGPLATAVLGHVSELEPMDDCPSFVTLRVDEPELSVLAVHTEQGKRVVWLRKDEQHDHVVSKCLDLAHLSERVEYLPERLTWDRLCRLTVRYYHHCVVFGICAHDKVKCRANLLLQSLWVNDESNDSKRTPYPSIHELRGAHGSI